MTSTVLYNHATPLFLAVEEADFRTALDICTQFPEQAAIFVINDDFKRLPLHEACRRQAPAWLVSALLEAYSTGAASCTQWGQQLPLHLAVECGASPEVINLLLVSYWPAVAVTDPSGRTPLEILEDDEEVPRTIQASLERAAACWSDLAQKHAENLQHQALEHDQSLQKVQQDHDQALENQHDQMLQVLRRVASMESQVQGAEQRAFQGQSKLQQVERAATQVQDDYHQLQLQLEERTVERDAARAETVQLQDLIRQKEVAHTQARRQTRALEQTLGKIHDYAQQPIRSRLTKTQDKIQGMLDAFVDLHNVLECHEQDLGKLLELRGLKESTTDEKKEVDTSTEHVEEEVEDEDEDAAILLAMQAATTSVMEARKI